jgi:hypothetical protein
MGNIYGRMGSYLLNLVETQVGRCMVSFVFGLKPAVISGIS